MRKCEVLYGHADKGVFSFGSHSAPLENDITTCVALSTYNLTSSGNGASKGGQGYSGIFILS